MDNLCLRWMYARLVGDGRQVRPELEVPVLGEISCQLQLQTSLQRRAIM